MRPPGSGLTHFRCAFTARHGRELAAERQYRHWLNGDESTTTRLTPALVSASSVTVTPAASLDPRRGP
ncbi:MAG: hypothetical protein AAB654_25620, partial [Acidobacteriota bacterium]